MAKIGLISICHADYAGGIIESLTAEAAGKIEEFGNEAVYAGEVALSDAQSYAQARAIISADVDGAVVFLSGWVECRIVMTAIRELRNIPLSLLGVPMFTYEGRQESTGSYVSYAMFKGVLDRLGYRYAGILSSLDSDEFRAEMTDFCLASQTIKRLSRTSLGLVGSTSMSIYTGTFDHMFMREKVGCEIDYLDSYTLIERSKLISAERLEQARREFTSKADADSDIEEEIIERTLRIYCAADDIIAEKGWAGINIKCQYEFSKEFKAVPCVPLSMLGDKTVASCEGDILNTVSMTILNYLSGQTAGYGDVITHFDNTVKLSSCGFIPFSTGAGNRVRNFMKHDGFNGIQCSFCPREGKVTVLRLIEDKCDYHILYFTGEIKKTALRQDYMPALDVEMDGRIEDLVKNYNGQHFAYCFGDHASAIEAYALLAGFKTIRV